MPFTDSDESARLLLQVMLLEMGLSTISTNWNAALQQTLCSCLNSSGGLSSWLKGAGGRLIGPRQTELRVTPSALIQSDSFTAWTAREEAEHAARMRSPWLLVMGSKDPKTVASGLTWMGRHLGEMLWRFQVCMEVDRLGTALTKGSMSTGMSTDK